MTTMWNNPNLLFYGGREYTTMKFPSSFRTWIKSLRIQLREKLPALDILSGSKYTWLSLKERKFIFLTTFSLLSSSSLLKVPIILNGEDYSYCCLFFQFFFHSETFELVYAIAGALLFSAFIVFDTHMLMNKLSPEEYILASINLYLDIINLFIEILRILEAMKKQ